MVLIDRRYGVATADEGVGAVLRRLSNCLSNRLGALAELVKLEDPRRTIPEDCLRLQDHLTEKLDRLGTDVQTLAIIGDVIAGYDLAVSIGSEVCGCDAVGAEYETDPILLCRLLDLARHIQLVLLQERLADVAATRLHEGIGHAARED